MFKIPQILINAVFAYFKTYARVLLFHHPPSSTPAGFEKNALLFSAKPLLLFSIVLIGSKRDQCFKIFIIKSVP